MRKPTAAQIETRARKPQEATRSRLCVEELCASPVSTHSAICTAYTTALKARNSGRSDAVGRLRACVETHKPN